MPRSSPRGAMSAVPDVTATPSWGDMTHDEILASYQRYRQAYTAIQTAALKCVFTASLLATAKRLRLSDGKYLCGRAEPVAAAAEELSGHRGQSVAKQ